MWKLAIGTNFVIKIFISLWKIKFLKFSDKDLTNFSRYQTLTKLGRLFKFIHARIHFDNYENHGESNKLYFQFKLKFNLFIYFSYLFGTIPTTFDFIGKAENICV